MRKFIVKHFALNYTVKFLGYYWTALRASRIIFPLFTISGLLITYTGWHILTYLLAASTLYALFLGFFYFNIWPVKWHELDDNQKLQAGTAISSGHSTMNLTLEEWEEWRRLLAKSRNESESK